jgi:hypothetical protein
MPHYGDENMQKALAQKSNNFAPTKTFSRLQGKKLQIGGFTNTAE